MARQQSKPLNKEFSVPPLFLNVMLAALALLFCLSLFKNISYPLLWNDESESTMMATRVLEYGYPKVNDGKNRIFAPDIPQSKIGYNEEWDACTYITWGNYFFATIGVSLADFSDDMYVKTALIRLPYALAGLAGLLIFLCSLFPFFNDKEKFKWFAILFIFLELFSVTLILHMRDARSYPLIIFICSCFFFIYLRRIFLKKFNYFYYVITMFFTLALAFHINFVTYVILSIIYVVHQLFLAFSVLKTRNSFKDLFSISLPFLKDAVPVIAAGLHALPLISFHGILETSKAVSEYHHYTSDTYYNNLSTMLHFFRDLDFLYTVLFVKALVFGLWYYFRNSKPVSKNQPTSSLMTISMLLLTFCLIYVFMIARIPYYIFARYIIIVQVVMSLMLVLDLFVIAELLTKHIKKENSRKYRTVIFVSVLLVFLFNARNKMGYVKDHIYELSHQYKGPLDYVIPYIKENFKNTDTLVIATNYEEYSYMYYLNSKVIIGYSLNNLEEDVKHIPDIIMFRKTWGTNPQPFNDFIQKAQYQKVTFPVADYPVNNIPELDFAIKHLFKTKMAASEQEKAEILIRVK